MGQCVLMNISTSIYSDNFFYRTLSAKSTKTDFA